MTSASAVGLGLSLALMGLAACASERPGSRVFREELDALDEAELRATSGDLDRLAELAWNARHAGIRDGAITRLHRALGGPADREAQAHVLNLFRLSPSKNAVVPQTPCRQGKAAGDGALCRSLGPIFAALGEHARPRLFAAEACASLGLRIVPVAEDAATSPWWESAAHCLYPDDTLADNDLYGLLRMRDLGRLPPVIDGTTVPARGDGLVEPELRIGRLAPARYRVLRFEDGKIAAVSRVQPVPDEQNYDRLDPQQQEFWRPLFEDLTPYSRLDGTDERPGERGFPELRWRGGAP